jgi:hypothetical protein
MIIPLLQKNLPLRESIFLVIWTGLPCLLSNYGFLEQKLRNLYNPHLDSPFQRSVLAAAWRPFHGEDSLAAHDFGK